MRLSIVIPALNEAASLPRLLAALRVQAGGLPLQLIVAEGGGSDGTREAAAAADVVLSAAGGRAAQMHAGAGAAAGDVLLFLHADTRLPEGWAEALAGAWSAEPRPAATAFRLGFDDPGLFYRLVARGARLRERLTGVPQGDQAIAVDREAYFRAGGFPPVPLMEEYLLMPRLRALGAVVPLPQAVATSTRRYERVGRLKNALRNPLIIILFYLGVSPARLARLYR